MKTGLTEKLLVSGNQITEQEDLIKEETMNIDGVESEQNAANTNLEREMVPGTRIWYGGNNTWALHELGGTDEYEILHQEDTTNGEDTSTVFTVKRLKTGSIYKTSLPERIRARFET